MGIKIEMNFDYEYLGYKLKKKSRKNDRLILLNNGLKSKARTYR